MKPITPENKPICNRCGKCCYYELHGEIKKCKYLVHVGKSNEMTSKLTSCRIYPNNVGVEIDEGVTCLTMKQHGFTYLGCPYNVGHRLKLINIRRYEDDIKKLSEMSSNIQN